MVEEIEMEKKELTIKIVDGQWFATLNGKHLTAQETQLAIAQGASYKFVK